MTKFYSFATAALVALFSVSPVGAKTVLVSNDGYQAAFKAARPGDIIKLVGSFSDFALQNMSFSKSVTIDARNATFSGTAKIYNVNNVKFVGGTFGSTSSSAAVAVRVQNSSNISLTSLSVIGDGENARGVDFISSNQVSVLNGSFSKLAVAVAFRSVNGGVIQGNISNQSSGDGFNVADSHNVEVSQNRCSGTIAVSGRHPDCVQLWSISGKPPQSDITVSKNVATGATQGFTSFDPDAGGGVRISIVGNRVTTSYPQGIACYNCRDSVISDNILSTQAGSKYQTTVHIVGGSQNVVANNVVGKYVVPRSKAASAMTTPATAVWSSAVPSANQFSIQAAGIQSAVPEPETWLTMTLGIFVVGWKMRADRDKRTLGRKGLML